MNGPLVSTKLHIPEPRPQAVLRSRLTCRLGGGDVQQQKLVLLSAPAGSGKTSLVSEWLAGCGRRAAWLSLDEDDNDPVRFLTYLISALRTIRAKLGDAALGALRSPQPPSAESVLQSLLEDLSGISEPFVLVLDDYHVLEEGPLDDAIAMLIERMPQQMLVVITTRQEPRLPLARMRARGQLTEIRAKDLRFTLEEAEQFLRQVMGLSLPHEEIALLESRTEGWIAGLQLAGLSLQGHSDPESFIRSFSGSHRYILDYLLEEVLERQSAGIRFFLEHTSILNRLSGPLCDAVLQRKDGQAMLELLERANLFLIPLDQERRWYRYHSLFADLLRQKLTAGIGENGTDTEAELHLRASEWYEEQGLDMEAFRHAAAARDMERAVRLLEGKGLPLIFRGPAGPVLNWLRAIPKEQLDARPSLWVMFASALLMAGQFAGVEPKLQAAENVLADAEEDEKNRDLIGHIASIRATLAVSRHQAETIMAQSQKALKYLHPDNLPVRTATTWTLGYACQLLGERTAAYHAYEEAFSTSRMIGHTVIAMMSALGLGGIQEAEKLLHQAADTYRQALQWSGEQPLPAACEAHLGLARIHLEWNELETAKEHGLLSVWLARQLEHTDRAAAGLLLLARVELARGEERGAWVLLAEAEHLAKLHGFDGLLPSIACAKEEVRHRRAAAETIVRARAETPPTRSNGQRLMEPLIEPLTRRELEVLQLIAHGLSNQEIAKRLGLAVSTVKGHNRIIFDKLQAGRRTEAVARARMLGLLDEPIL